MCGLEDLLDQFPADFGPESGLWLLAPYFFVLVAPALILLGCVMWELIWAR